MEEPEYLFGNDEHAVEGMPHSKDGEQAILAACLTSESCLLQAIELLEPDQFYYPSHKYVFESMIVLFELGREINPITIADHLKQVDKLHYVGGVGDISGLTVGMPYIDSIESYANLLIGKSKLRDIIKAGNSIVSEAIAQQDEPDFILASAETKIYQITETRHTTQLAAIDDTIEQAITNAHDNIGLTVSVTGLRTGITKLDNLTTGFQNSDLILLAARPTVGKTSEAVSIMINTALDYGNTVAFFSLEMARLAIVERMICNRARVDFQSFRRGFLLHDEWDRIDEARAALKCNRIFVDDKPAISILEARAKLRRLESTIGKKPDLVVFDYLQLMTGLREHRKESRQQEVSGISAGLKTLAKELDRPVLALSQLKRGSEAHTPRKPQLSDLRESGSLEQDADLVVFIDRFEQDGEFLHEQIIAKNRNGPIDSFGIFFNGPAMRFDNLD